MKKIIWVFLLAIFATFPAFGEKFADRSSEEIIIFQADRGCADYCLTLTYSDDSVIQRVYHRDVEISRNVVTVRDVQRTDIALIGGDQGQAIESRSIDLTSPEGLIVPLNEPSPPLGGNGAVVNSVTYYTATEMVTVNTTFHFANYQLISVDTATVRSPIGETEPY